MTIPEASSNSSSIRALEIAHVLFMDIVAYSQLPMDEQTRLIEKLQQIVRNTNEFGRAQKRRQLLRLPTGDGMALVFFGDVEAPARCALEIGHAVRELPELKLRMGIHTGPVQRVEDINANRNVAGGGINLAQRVMDCGDAGHILISKSVADVLNQVSAWKGFLHDLGEAEVKHGVRVHLFNLFTDEDGNRELPQKLRATRDAAVSVAAQAKRKKVTLGGIAIVVIAVFVIGGILYSRRAHALTDKDTIVLADFTNRTGDPIFDDTLKTALSISLRQSPFLNVLSDNEVAKTLQQMTRPANTKLTPELARELCLRVGNKAYLAGSIGNLGDEYVLSLKAVNCLNGDTLAEEQVTAASKETVLDVLGNAATKLRGKLGESLVTVQKFDVPLYQATTSSLEALRAYSRGAAADRATGDADALPFFKEAVELDPNFAVARTSLGMSYLNLALPSLAADNLRMAYDLRDRVSEREKYRISAFYNHYVTGDVDKAIQTYELWAQSYPRDTTARLNLGFLYANLGRLNDAVAVNEDLLRADPNDAWAYVDLASAYLRLNRFDDVRTTIERAQSHKLDRGFLHQVAYFVSFLDDDVNGMERELAWSQSRPSDEAGFRAILSDTEAYYGRVVKAHEFTRRAADSATQADRAAEAALWRVNAALREAEVGDSAAAKHSVTDALALSHSGEVSIISALTLTRIGDSESAENILAEVQQNQPNNAFLKRYWLPTIKASIEVKRGRAEQALVYLEATEAFELGDAGSSINFLYPAYVRGQAYLLAHNGTAAAAEFQKLLDHRGIVLNFVTGAVAHLQIGRAYAMAGDTAKAKAAYQDFLRLWKVADPDIPILKQAKEEYANLR